MSGTITVAEVASGGRNNNIQIIFKNCAPFTDSISEIKNTQIDNAKEIDVVMAVQFNRNCDNYSKTSGSF